MPCHGKRVEPGISQGKQVKGILEAKATATTFLGSNWKFDIKKKKTCGDWGLEGWGGG